MDFAAARATMVETRVRSGGVNDPAVVRAIAEVPREVFLPKPMRCYAYLDRDLDLGGGRFVIEPGLLAKLLDRAQITPNDVVLTIGDAAGYVTAVAARLAQTVVAVESDEQWADHVSHSLCELAVDNAAVMLGSLADGLPEQQPYDVIVLAGLVRAIPMAISQQLAEGGRLVAVVGDEGRGTAMLQIRGDGGWGTRPLFDAVLAPLPLAGPQERFEF